MVPRRGATPRQVVPGLFSALGLTWHRGELYVSHVVPYSTFAPAHTGRVIAYSGFDGRRFRRSGRMNASARGGVVLADKKAVLSGTASSTDDTVAWDWQTIKSEAQRCKRCPLFHPATQTVFGEGPLDARLMLVGEQPGDQEDLAGRVYVGPAGKLLDAALEEAGIERRALYITNAVKHFKYEQRGKRRIHQTPTAGEVQACRWWLGQELAIIRPRIIVALGASAARVVLGWAVTIGQVRGAAILLEDGAEAWVTVHPSYLLRLPDAARQAEEQARFVAELRMVGERLTALA